MLLEVVVSFSKKGNCIGTPSPVLHFLKRTVRGCQHLPFNSHAFRQAEGVFFPSFLLYFNSEKQLVQSTGGCYCCIINVS